MTEPMRGWAGQPLEPMSGRGSQADDEAKVTRLEGIKDPTQVDWGVLAAVRARTPEGSLRQRVMALTQRWNQHFADAKAAVEQAGRTTDDGPRFLR